MRLSFCQCYAQHTALISLSLGDNVVHIKGSKNRNASFIALVVMMMKLPILPCAEKLELVLSTARW